MLTKKSVFHVNQTEGKFYDPSRLKGYYNNLTDKVRYTTLFDEAGIPLNIASYGEKRETVYFPIAIFQFGLGAWDLYLENGEERNRTQVLKMCDWALSHQEIDGSWNSFGILHYANPYSSMAQGEGISLLVRGWMETGAEKYLKAALSAAEFMLKPEIQGGTAQKGEDEIILLEYPGKPLVLNGWIFSSFGLYDLWLATGDERWYLLWQKSVRGIKKRLCTFDHGHWSYYDDHKKLASPFYHRLHVELLKAMNALAPDPIFSQYIHKWDSCQRNFFWSKAAFIRKAFQKLAEKKQQEWVLTG